MGVCPFTDFLICYQLMSITFAVLVVLITLRVKVGNRYLLFWGENLFAAYMLQRLPDIVNIGLHFFLKNVRPYAAFCCEA